VYYLINRHGAEVAYCIAVLIFVPRALDIVRLMFTRSVILDPRFLSLNHAVATLVWHLDSLLYSYPLVGRLWKGTLVSRGGGIKSSSL